MSQMNEILICKHHNCNKYILNLVLLPCSKNIWQSHVQGIYEMNNESNLFKFQFCNGNPEIPENGFILNDSLIK